MACLILAAVLLLGLAACATTPPVPRVYANNTQAIKGSLALALQGPRQPITIDLSAYGVPYITATTETDLAFALGYMHARDRRFQMELYRMDSMGRLRELVGGNAGESIIRLELAARALDFRGQAERLLFSLSAEDIAMLAAYSEGVNRATEREPVPFEFKLLRYRPQPWEPLDCISIMELVSFGFCKNWEQELARLEIMVNQLKTGGTIERALAIWKPRFDFPPHLIGTKPARDPFAGIPPLAPELAKYLTDTITPVAGTSPGAAPAAGPRTQDAAADTLAMMLDFSSAASNNWAVSGAWTGTGKAALAEDPHMPLSLPSMIYLASIRLQGLTSYQVVGGSIPGLPAIPFGTNGRVAWGPTSNWADVTDLYVEMPSEKDGFYKTENGDVPFTVRHEVFRIKRAVGFTEETRTFRMTRHGPLVNDFQDQLAGDFPLVALSKGETFGRTLTSIRQLYRAGTVQEARTALSGFTAMVGHWALADSSGGIAYTGPVNLPLRPSHLGTVPVPGWNGTYEWKTFVSPQDIPGMVNPPAGFLSTANNQVIQPESTGYPVDFEGDVGYRAARITGLLALGGGNPDIAAYMAAIQMDGLDASIEGARKTLTRALGPLTTDPDPFLAAAARDLIGWDGAVTPESALPTIYESFLSQILRRVMSDEVSRPTLDWLLFYFNADPLLFSILEDPSNPAWDDRLTPEVETADAVMQDAFRSTVRALSEAYGTEIADWSWSRAAPFTLRHPFGKMKLMEFLNRPGLPPQGSAHSVFMHKFGRADPIRFPIEYGPAMRLVVDLANLPHSLMSIPGGQSGRSESPHYADILPLYLKGEGVGLEMGARVVDTDTSLRVTIVPFTR